MNDRGARDFYLPLVLRLTFRLGQQRPLFLYTHCKYPSGTLKNSFHKCPINVDLASADPRVPPAQAFFTLDWRKLWELWVTPEVLLAKFGQVNNPYRRTNSWELLCYWEFESENNECVRAQRLQYSGEFIGRRRWRYLSPQLSPFKFELPPVVAQRRQRWRRCVDTALASPDDFYSWESAPFVKPGTYVVQPRSAVILTLPLQAADEAVSQAR